MSRHILIDMWDVIFCELLKHATKLDFWRSPVRILTAFGTLEK